MTEFKGKVAVVTGCASGIGLALARRFAQEGMHVVLADIETEPLEAAAREIRAMGATALTVQTDVSRFEDVERLAARALDTFGSVHIVCNNAGVGGAGGFIWEYALEDWQWLLGVNLWGVIHGVRAFVPRLLKQGEEAHIVNTASIAGISFGTIFRRLQSEQTCGGCDIRGDAGRTGRDSRPDRSVGVMPGRREYANHGRRPESPGGPG